MKRPPTFDFSSFKKIWHSDVLESEVAEISNLITHNPLLNESLILRDSCLAVLDIRTMQYPCILGDVEKVCGWSKEILLEEGVQFFVAHMPPADYQGLEEMNKLITEYIVSLSEIQVPKFRAIFDYKMIRADGSVCRIIQESISLKRDAKGNILFFLALASDITSLKRDHRQHLRLTDGNENLLYEVDNTTGKCHSLDSISKRELEIIRLTGQNLTSQAIAERLFISPHTVNTHRRNMLRKFGMTDTMELINFLTIYRLI